MVHKKELTLEEQVVDAVADAMLLKDAARQKVGLKTRFVEDLSAEDSDIFSIITKVEEVFKVDISDDDQQGLKTAQDIVNYLKKPVG